LTAACGHGTVEEMIEQGQRLFLRVGEQVHHLKHREWGLGIVEQVMTSVLPGGTCLVRVRFPDGSCRTFENNLDNRSCAYYFGLRRAGEVDVLAAMGWKGGGRQAAKPAPKKKKLKGAVQPEVLGEVESSRKRRKKPARKKAKKTRKAKPTPPPGRLALIAEVAERRKARAKREGKAGKQR